MVGLRNKKTKLSTLTVPGRWSALTRSQTAPSQKQIRKTFRRTGLEFKDLGKSEK